MGEVFCVLSHYRDSGQKQNKVYWSGHEERIREAIIEPTHKTVHDRDGNKMCRTVKLDLAEIANYGPRYGDFKFYCNTIRMNLLPQLSEANLVPNTIVSLAGARIFAQQLFFSITTSPGQEVPLYGVTKMRRIVQDNVVVDYEYDPGNFAPGFSPEKAKVVLVDDFVDNARSAEIAAKKIRSTGGEILAFVCFGNSYGEELPFDVPVNISFINLLDIEKYPAGTCPTCLASKGVQ